MVRKECKMSPQSKKDYYLISKTQNHETISKPSHLWHCLESYSISFCEGFLFNLLKTFPATSNHKYSKAQTMYQMIKYTCTQTLFECKCTQAVVCCSLAFLLSFSICGAAHILLRANMFWIYTHFVIQCVQNYDVSWYIVH